MNVARFFVEKRQIAWVALVATLVWGVFAYLRMPQRKDPEVVIKTAVVTTAWPGASAEDVESLITRPIELVAGQVPRADTVTSTTRAGLSTVFVTLEDTVKRRELEPAWNDLQSRLDLLSRSLPPEVRAPQLNTHFGDTATLTLSVASPRVDALELDLRDRAIRRTVEAHRARTTGPRMTTVFIPPQGLTRDAVVRASERYVRLGEAMGVLEDAAVLRSTGFVAIDYRARAPEQVAALNARFQTDVVGGERPHPDVWGPIVFGEPSELRGRLEETAGAKYGDRQLDRWTEQLRDGLARLPGVARVDRHGVVPEKVYLLYSQERLASLGIHPGMIADALKARNVTVPAGGLGTGRQVLQVDASSAWSSTDEILDTVLTAAPGGAPVYLRDVVEVRRSYETPAREFSTLTWRDGDGRWQTTRSIALAIQARKGVQVTAIGEQVDAQVAELARALPPDLRIARTSDQPHLVEEKIGEFMRSLVEAVIIVIAIALVFMERRSAILVAASIPLTLAMTFGFMDLLGMDLQQVSIASLIIALGLLVDDPVIASDAINRELAAGVPRHRAAWQGPTRLAKAIVFATLTNIVAFAPLLLVSGTMGEFIYSLPVVVTLSLVSSRLVSMTFMPLLGFYLLKGQKGYEAALEGTGRSATLARKYNAITEWMLDHKRVSLLAFLAFLVLGLLPARLIRTQFFPEEAMSRFYVHVKLPEGSDVRATEEISTRARAVLLDTEGERLARITTFVGSGGPRWWSNVSPEPRNPAYALFIVETKDANDSRAMIGRAQRALSERVAGARFEVYRISSGKPAVTQVEVRLSGPDMDVLRRLGAETAGILRGLPQTADVMDDWGPEALKVEVKVDSSRAHAAQVTHADVAQSTLLALNGNAVTQLRDADRLIDVVLRLSPDERGSAGEVRDLYVWSGRSRRGVPLEQVASLERALEPQKIVRRGMERTLTVGAIPRDGELASVLLDAARPALAQDLHLPPGYSLDFGGEQEQQARAFAAVSIALKVSVALIFLVLVWQFAHVFKPLIVFAAIPFGMVGVVLGLTLTRTNFGFMAFLGVASLIGVIVSHIIVLFDFIEEARQEGVPLHRAVIDAGLVRLRPVLVTVLATVGGLIPLAVEGGPMWRQLVYVQIGGLLLATLVTKGVVPLLYVFAVETLKVIKWEPDPVDADDHRPLPARVQHARPRADPEAA